MLGLSNTSVAVDDCPKGATDSTSRKAHASSQPSPEIWRTDQWLFGVIKTLDIGESDTVPSIVTTVP